MRDLGLGFGYLGDLGVFYGILGYPAHDVGDLGILGCFLMVLSSDSGLINSPDKNRQVLGGSCCLRFKILGGCLGGALFLVFFM